MGIDDFIDKSYMFKIVKYIKYILILIITVIAIYYIILFLGIDFKNKEIYFVWIFTIFFFIFFLGSVKPNWKQLLFRS